MMIDMVTDVQFAQLEEYIPWLLVFVTSKTLKQWIAVFCHRLSKTNWMHHLHFFGSSEAHWCNQ